MYITNSKEVLYVQIFYRITSSEEVLGIAVKDGDDVATIAAVEEDKVMQAFFKVLLRKETMLLVPWAGAVVVVGWGTLAGGLSHGVITYFGVYRSYFFMMSVSYDSVRLYH